MWEVGSDCQGWAGACGGPWGVERCFLPRRSAGGAGRAQSGRTVEELGGGGGGVVTTEGCFLLPEDRALTEVPQ